MDRKLDTAAIFERLFSVYASQFTLLAPAALLLFLPVALIGGAIASGGGIGLALLASLLSVAANVWFQGMVIEAVRDIQDGKRDFTIGGLFQAVLPVLAPLLGIGILAGIGIFIGLLLLIVPGLFLLTIWAVVAPTVVIERRGLDAFGRSRELVRGNGWRVFGVIVVVYLIQLIVSQVLGAILGGADSFVAVAIGTLASGALVAPITAIAAALLYLELRKLKGESAVHAGAEPAGSLGSSGPGSSSATTSPEGAPPSSPERPA